MAAVQAEAWANPSSLHGFGLAAAEQLERSRQGLAHLLGCTTERLVFTSGGSESIHLALLGSAAALEAAMPSAESPRLLVSAVEHPATRAACAVLQGPWAQATGNAAVASSCYGIRHNPHFSRGRGFCNPRLGRQRLVPRSDRESEKCRDFEQGKAVVVTPPLVNDVCTRNFEGEAELWNRDYICAGEFRIFP